MAGCCGGGGGCGGGPTLRTSMPIGPDAAESRSTTSSVVRTGCPATRSITSSTRRPARSARPPGTTSNTATRPSAFRSMSRPKRLSLVGLTRVNTRVPAVPAPLLLRLPLLLLLEAMLLFVGCAKSASINDACCCCCVCCCCAPLGGDGVRRSMKGAGDPVTFAAAAADDDDDEPLLLGRPAICSPSAVHTPEPSRSPTATSSVLLVAAGSLLLRGRVAASSGGCCAGSDTSAMEAAIARLRSSSFSSVDGTLLRRHSEMACAHCPATNGVSAVRVTRKRC